MTRMQTLGKETSALLTIALPLMFAYLADIAMVITAKIVLGRLGFRELAAAGISSDLSYQVAIVLMGFFSVVGVLVAEAYGASRHHDAAAALLQGLCLATVLGVAMSILVWNLDWLLAMAGQDAEVVSLTRPFLDGFAWSMLPVLWFAVLKGFAAALMRTGVVMSIAVVAVILNYFLMQGLVHGDFGLPRLGMAGAGIAWCIIGWLKFLCLAAFVAVLVRREKLQFRELLGWQAVGTFMPFIRLGLPVAGIVALESGLFAAISLMSGWLGAEPLAAYQILMGWIAIPFVISLGLAEAAMVRVAYWTGAGKRQSARRAGLLGMLLGVAIPAGLLVVPLGFPSLITLAFLDAGDAGFSSISALVTRLLFIAAIFQVFDGLQAVASHALRGIRDATVPLIIAAIGYWVVGLGAAYVMGFVFDWKSTGLWWGLALGLTFTGTLLAWRFNRLSRVDSNFHPQLPSSPRLLGGGEDDGCGWPR